MSESPANNVFRTKSPLVATWLEYAHRIEVRFLRYDPQTREYHFWDPDGRTHALINDYNQVDPTVNLRRFHKTYNTMLAEKMQLDGQWKHARKAVRP